MIWGPDLISMNMIIDSCLPDLPLGCIQAERDGEEETAGVGGSVQGQEVKMAAICMTSARPSDAPITSTQPSYTRMTSTPTAVFA